MHYSKKKLEEIVKDCTNTPETRSLFGYDVEEVEPLAKDLLEAVELIHESMAVLNSIKTSCIYTMDMTKPFREVTNKLRCFLRFDPDVDKGIPNC